MYTLPHTHMRVPTLDIDLVYVRGTQTAWSAVLRYVLSNLGHVDHEYGATRLRPTGHSARSLFDTFVAQCRGADGEPLTEEEVLVNLHTEQAWAREIPHAEHRGAFAVRIDLADGTDRARLPLFGDIAPPSYEDAARRINWAKLPADAVSASLWMGPARGWVEYYRAPGA